jgi:3-oxoacyl-[acyl-carrier-protein] synthase II
MKKRVFVTGMGMVTPLGHNVTDTWQALLNRKSGIQKIKSFDASQFLANIAAEVKDFNIDTYLSDKKLLKNSTRFTSFGLKASQEALDDAGISPHSTNFARWGLTLGSGMMTADFPYLEKFQRYYFKEGQVDIAALGQQDPHFLKISDFIKNQSNSAQGLLQQYHQIQGYSTTVHTACASGGQALGLALQAIRRGEIDYALTGGLDSMINPIGLSGFCLLGALSTDNESPESASRPFDLTRNGFVLGEGAAFLVLESEESAKERGAKIYAELAGEGNSLSSYRITDSPASGDGAYQAVEQALYDADLSPKDVDYINAHGTSTKMNDLSETNAIKHVFKENAYQIPVSSTKSQTGHLIAAAGALEGAFCALALYHSQIPMTANLKHADPDCDLDYVTEGPREKQIKVALSNSFGFGGTNSCLAFKKVSL